MQKPYVFCKWIDMGMLLNRYIKCLFIAVWLLKASGSRRVFGSHCSECDTTACLLHRFGIWAMGSPCVLSTSQAIWWWPSQWSCRPLLQPCELFGTWTKTAGILSKLIYICDFPICSVFVCVNIWVQGVARTVPQHSWVTFWLFMQKEMRHTHNSSIKWMLDATLVTSEIWEGNKTQVLSVNNMAHKGDMYIYII